MVEHRVTVDLFVDSDVFFSAEVIRVTRPDQLPSALAQKTKQVIIENDEIRRRLLRLREWQEARYWFFGALVAALMGYAMSRDYKIEASWHRDWKVNTTDEKVTLTPIKRK